MVVAEDVATSPADVPLPEPFEPPYPLRDNLFRRPAVESAPQLVRQTDEQEIVLKGFINVDEIRALLEIDGRVTAIPAGGSVGDIRLESISPHGVTLKKGRAQWQFVLATDEVE